MEPVTLSVACSEHDYRGAERLRFADPLLEQEFQQEYFQPKANAFISTWGLLPGVAILMGFWLLDVMSVSSNNGVVLRIRICEILPLLVLWILRKHPLVDRALRGLYTFYLWWLGTSVMLIIAAVPSADPVHRAYVVSLPMVVLTMFIAKPYWRLALTCAALLAIEYVLLVWGMGIDPLLLGGDWRGVAGVELVLLSALTIGAITCYVIETGERREFVAQYILREAKARLAAQKEELADTLSSLEVANEELRRLARERSELAAIAAHDLKNPLAGIKLQLEVLQRYSHRMSPQQFEATLQTMTDAAERMLSIVSTFLDHHAIETGNFHVNCSTFDLGEVLAAATKQLQPRSAAKGIVLCFERQPAVVYADQNLTLHVTENLISNAIKFSPSNSTVEIFLADSKSGMITFGVRDQGPGLTESDQAKLFGAFQRLSAKPTGGESSTGLGLSITKRMVEAMGGRIWCESRPGMGATFFVALPAMNVQSPNGTDTVPSAAVRLHDVSDSLRSSVDERLLTTG